MAIVFAIIIFSFLIFIHELGHFLAAKASNVQVNEFAMFMGPALVKWQRGETQYSIRCIPLGGYCAMEGEDEDTDNPRSFQKAAWWKRLGILLAGAGMNFISGFLIFALVLAPSAGFVQPVIAEAEAGNTIVYEEGLHIGDRLLKINGNRVYISSDATMLFNLESGDTYDLVVERDGKKVELNDFPMEKHAFANTDGSTSMRFGILFGYAEKTFGSLMSYTWNTCLSVVQSVRLSLQMLLSGQAGLNDVAGPVGIVSMMNTTAQASATTLDAILNLLYFGAFIAVNLAVMNLLPIPALDGGRAVALLLTVAIEKITHRKLDPKYEGYLMKQKQAMDENGFYSDIISSSAVCTIICDSIQLDEHERKFKYYGTQLIKRRSRDVKRSIVTVGNIETVPRTQNNPHGLLVTNWRTLENKDLDY